jgi:hypothetical protein
MKPDTSFATKSGHFHLLTTLKSSRLFTRNLAEPSETFEKPTFTGSIRTHGADGSLVVPMEELMRDLPLTVTLEQSEYVRSSCIGSSQLA